MTSISPALHFHFRHIIHHEKPFFYPILCPFAAIQSCTYEFSTLCLSLFTLVNKDVLLYPPQALEVVPVLPHRGEVLRFWGLELHSFKSLEKQQRELLFMRALDGIKNFGQEVSKSNAIKDSPVRAPVPALTPTESKHSRQESW